MLSSTFLQKSQLQNASFNTSFNTSSIAGAGLNYSRRGGGGRGDRDGTVLMSTGLTQSLEAYGTPLPAMVKVAISSCNAASDGRHFSCRLDSNGWGWLVTGRKLYVWRHTPEIGKKSPISCRELVLPPSELVHHANLVAVLPSCSTTAPAVLALSPEGHITYWPNISNESNTVTVNADIPGQECDSLTSIWPVGAIVTTTTSTVLLIKTSSGRGNKPGLSCVPLVAQKSWLGGWSKKMSTMLFTAVPSAPSGLDSKRARVVVPMSKDNDDPMSPGNNKEGKVYIFQGSALQTWQFMGDSHLCLSEINIEEYLRRQFIENVWAIDEDGRDSSRASAIQTWILDIACLPHSKQIAVFAAAKSGWETSENLVYGIVTFDIKRHRQREMWSFIPVVCSASSSALEDYHLYAWKLLATQSHYFVISNECILTAVAENDGATDAIDSGTLGGPIIGAGNVAFNTVVVLVPKLGLLSIKPAVVQDCLGLDETFSEVRVPDHLALSMTQPYIPDLDENEDTLFRYKSAFLLYLQKKVEDCGVILNDLFPLNPNHTVHMSQASCSLDSATLSIAERLIDEAPSADPRWGTSFRNDEQDVGLKSKILIKNFLVDKRESLELFVSFLNNTGIWARLRGITVKEDVLSTSSLLYNAYEKVYFALTLQNMQAEQQFRKVLDTAIRSIVMMRKEKDCQVRSSHLSPNDLFYKQVSRVHQIIPALVSIQEEEFQSLGNNELPARLLLTNEVLLRALLEVHVVATGPGEKLFQVQDFLIKPLLISDDNEYQVLPWIVEPNTLRALTKQHELIASSGISNIEIETGLKLELMKQLQQFTDIILDALKTNLISIENSDRYPLKLQKFENLRSKLLRTHLQVKDYDGGSLLAEKYLDFEILATICYDRKDIECLTEFFYKYDDLNFPEFTWEWYIRQGKAAELVDTFSTSQFKDRLGVFLKKYPNISWHHATVNDEFGNAATVLRGLASKEEALAEDKKFLLCLSKLAALANTDAREEDQNDFVNDVDRNLRLLEFQTRLPDDVLNVYGMEKESMRVLSPSEMIDMYTTSEVHFEPDNFTNALGLAEFMINEELQVEKRLLITFRAIQRDPWESWTNPDHPMDVVSNTALYHFLVAAINKGWTLDEVYPLPSLFAFPDMRTLVENPNIKFLLRACHEQFLTTLADMQAAADYAME